MAKKQEYDWKKTAKKFGVDFGIVFLTGLISVWQNDPKYLVFIPVIKAVLNWLKHR